MGQLISDLNNAAKNSGDIFLEWKYAEAKGLNEKVKESHEANAKFLQSTLVTLRALEGYKGCGDAIRRALTSPGQESEDAAWQAVLPAVEVQKQLADSAVELGRVVDAILRVLFSEAAQLNDIKALALQLCDCFEFAVKFDEIKAASTNLENDFSYYRRTIARIKGSGDDPDAKMTDADAERVASFFKLPMPMVKVFVDTFVKEIAEDKFADKKILLEALCKLIDTCMLMIEKKKADTDAKVTYTVCVTGGCILLVDLVSAEGAFTKKNPANTKKALQLMKKTPTPHTKTLVRVINTLNIHLGEATAYSDITKLMQELSV